MKGLTGRQVEVLNFIRTYSMENGCPPTIRECASNFGISLGAIQCHFAALQKKGYLSHSDKRSRSVRVIMDEDGHEPLPAAIRIPLLGAEAAGKPLLSEENYDGYVNLVAPFVKNDGTYFALRVKGSSMVKAGILDGDIAVLRQCSEVEDGQIVVAVLDEAVTLKRFYRENSRIRLQPENDEFKPIYCQDVHVLGVLSSIIRSY